jgi:hypothetical protein
MELLKDGKVNTAYYNRWWKEETLGAMGLSLRKRAFSIEIFLVDSIETLLFLIVFVGPLFSNTSFLHLNHQAV